MDSEDINFLNVTKSFRTGFGKQRLAVKDLSLSVPRGKVVGLLGPNGSGKSTSIKMTLGFLQPSSGQILVCGVDSRELSARKQIGYLPENPRFQKFLSGRDILTYHGALHRMGGADLKKRVDELLEMVSLGHAAKERVQGYSKGMTQRLAVAQALLNHPRILIFDEPMSGLDPLGRMEIRRLIAHIHEQMPDSTIFFSTHVLEDVEQLCSMVALLRKGELKKFCSLEELLDLETQRFDITAKNLPKEFEAKCFQELSARFTAAGTLFTVMGTKTLTQTLTQLTDSGVEVIGVNSHRKKLEEVLFRDEPGKAVEL